MMKWGWLFPLSLSLASLGFAAYRGQDRIGRASLFSGAAIALPLYWALFSVTRGRGLEHVFYLLVLGGFCAFFAILFTDDWRRGAGTGSELTPARDFYLVSLTRSAAPGLANLFFASALWLAGGRFGPQALAAFVGALTLHRMVEAGLRFIGIPVLPWFAQRVEGLGGLAPYRRQLLLLILAPLAAGALAAGALWQAGGPMLERFFQVPAQAGWMVLAPLALSMPFYALYVVTRPLLDAIDRRPLALISMLAGTLLTLILHGVLMAARLSQDVLAINVACGATLMGLVNLGFVFRGLPRLRFALLAPLVLVLGFVLGLGLGALLKGWLS